MSRRKQRKEQQTAIKNTQFLNLFARRRTHSCPPSPAPLLRRTKLTRCAKRARPESHKSYCCSRHTVRSISRPFGAQAKYRRPHSLVDALSPHTTHHHHTGRDRKAEKSSTPPTQEGTHTRQCGGPSAKKVERSSDKKCF